jgi:GTP cyclohydrolase I
MSPDGTPAVVPLHAVPAGETPAIDRDRAQQAVADLLAALGQDLRSPHLAETPRRAADALIELLTPERFRITTFPNDEGYADLVLLTDIPFHSLCEHHLLPFRGVAQVGYLPGDRLVGLSKLARIVEHVSRALQVQERMTQQIAEWLEAELAPRGVGVVLEAEHLCMSLRGPRIVGSVTTTSTFSGLLGDDPRLRRSFEARCAARGTERVS